MRGQLLGLPVATWTAARSVATFHHASEDYDTSKTQLEQRSPFSGVGFAAATGRVASSAGQQRVSLPGSAWQAWEVFLSFVLFCYSVFTCKFNKGWSGHLTFLGVPFELHPALNRRGLLTSFQLGTMFLIGRDPMIPQKDSCCGWGTFF